MLRKLSIKRSPDGPLGLETKLILCFLFHINARDALEITDPDIIHDELACMSYNYQSQY